MVICFKGPEALLGCVEYKQTTRSRRSDQASDTQEHPCYAGLGAIENFQDGLITFAYVITLPITLNASRESQQAVIVKILRPR